MYFIQGAAVKHTNGLTASKFAIVLKYLVFFINLIISTSCSSRLVNNVDKLMTKYPFIQSIEERRRWNGSGGDWIDPLALDIKMSNGRRIFVSYISSDQLRSPFIIDLVDTSTFIVRYECEATDTYWARTGIPSEYIAKALLINVDSIDDVIVNYDKIKNFVDSLTKLRDIVPNGQITFYYNKNDLLDFYGSGWLKRTKPLVLKKDNDFEKLFILNIEGNKFPNFYTNQEIIIKDWREYNYLHQRK
jgi:hypothetical protein